MRDNLNFQSEPKICFTNFFAFLQVFDAMQRWRNNGTPHY